MKRIFLVAISGAALAMAAAPTSFAAPQPSPGTPATPGEAARFCVEVVGRGADAHAPSPSLFKKCDTTIERAEAARREWESHRPVKNTAGVTSQVAASLASSDLLVTLFSDINYGGSQTNIYGAYGPCDGAGYRLTMDSWWRSNLSSIAGTSLCTHAIVYNQANTLAANFGLPVSWMGPNFNDNVDHIQAYYG